MESDKPKSPILQELKRIFTDGIKRIDNNECDESQVYGMMSRFNAESKGFFDKNSFVNYDKAMRITGIKSRNKFKETCNEHHIEQKVINNQKVGFLKSDIENLAKRLKNSRKQKEKSEDYE